MSSRPKKHRIYVGKDAHKFSAAHMTVFPDGTKERLHGHNFQVTVALDLSEIGFQSFLDFSVVKTALNAQCKEWDDRLILAANCPFFKIVAKSPQELEFTLCGKRYVIPQDELVLLNLENIATETLAQEFCHQFKGRLDPALFQSLILGIEVHITESRGQGGMYYWEK
ncbi:MAG: 6-carboxytetrahydropterin synthase [Bdellovibrionales bacterium]|nr:6-carboxytetrahydropterin synthase [Bdellovibrionales bacterium]